MPRTPAVTARFSPAEVPGLMTPPGGPVSGNVLNPNLARRPIQAPIVSAIAVPLDLKVEQELAWKAPTKLRSAGMKTD